MRGRREALAERVGVHIVVATDRVVVARIRDDGGVRDVVWSHDEGWRCTCGDLACAHADAVRQTTTQAVA